MAAVSVLYNLVMLAIDAGVFRLLRRGMGPAAWLGAVSIAAVFGLVWGGVLGAAFEDLFGIVRLWCYGLFLHGTLLAAMAVFFWRRRHPTATIAVFLLALGLMLTAAYAFLIEPHRLEVTYYRISSPKIHRPWRIVLVADLQTNHLGPYERSVLERVVEDRPDLILFAGDYVQAWGEKYDVLAQQLHDSILALHLQASAFAVRGNVDQPQWTKIFAGTPVKAVETTCSFTLAEVQLTCLSLADSRRTKLRLPPAEEERFHLVLGHSPDYALGEVSADLLLAGHTHGGQVRFPLLGPMIINSRVPKRWAAGLTDLPGGGKLLVSRGLGMERGYAPPLRFLCRPELAVIELLPENPPVVSEGVSAVDDAVFRPADP